MNETTVYYGVRDSWKSVMNFQNRNHKKYEIYFQRSKDDQPENEEFRQKPFEFISQVDSESFLLKICAAAKVNYKMVLHFCRYGPRIFLFFLN